jgi:radical SAM-linked protein
MQRLRIRFCRGEKIKFISHLDIIRLWERALHRSRIPLAYSEGFSPHPRISLAAPLAVGVTSEAELMDVFVSKPVSPHWFTGSVSRQLPNGIEILGVYPIPLTIPSLQSQVRYAEYEVEVETECKEDIESTVSALLSMEQLPWHHHRDTGRRSYDLRALINDVWLINGQDRCGTLGMRLRCDSGGSGRPEQVIQALGFTHHPRSIRRTRLILETSR